MEEASGTDVRSQLLVDPDSCGRVELNDLRFRSLAVNLVYRKAGIINKPPVRSHALVFTGAGRAEVVKYLHVDSIQSQQA